MTIWYDYDTNRWLASTYGEAYDKACETQTPVYYENSQGVYEKIKRPQAPDLTIKGGKLRVKEMPDI